MYTRTFINETAYKEDSRDLLTAAFKNFVPYSDDPWTIEDIQSVAINSIASAFVDVEGIQYEDFTIHYGENYHANGIGNNNLWSITIKWDGHSILVGYLQVVDDMYGRYYTTFRDVDKDFLDIKEADYRIKGR